jgi:hypothetical protein
MRLSVGTLSHMQRPLVSLVVLPAAAAAAAAAATIAAAALLQTAWRAGRVCGYWPQLLGNPQWASHGPGSCRAHRAWQLQIVGHLFI